MSGSEPRAVGVEQVVIRQPRQRLRHQAGFPSQLTTGANARIAVQVSTARPLLAPRPGSRKTRPSSRAQDPGHQRERPGSTPGHDTRRPSDKQIRGPRLGEDSPSSGGSPGRRHPAGRAWPGSSARRRSRRPYPLLGRNAFGRWLIISQPSSGRTTSTARHLLHKRRARPAPDQNPAVASRSVHGVLPERQGRGRPEQEPRHIGPRDVAVSIDPRHAQQGTRHHPANPCPIPPRQEPETDRDRERIFENRGQPPRRNILHPAPRRCVRRQVQLPGQRGSEN